LPELACFLPVLKETEHFCGCGQEKVAKIVQCGEQYSTGRSSLSTLAPSGS
jgi:hypothetical protein